MFELPEPQDITCMKMAPARNRFIWAAFIVAMIIIGVYFALKPIALMSIIATSIITALLHNQVLKRIDAKETRSKINLVENLNLAVLRSIEAVLRLTDNERTRLEVLRPLMNYLIHPGHSLEERKDLFFRLLPLTHDYVIKQCREVLEEQKLISPLPKKDSDKRGKDEVDFSIDELNAKLTEGILKTG